MKGGAGLRLRSLVTTDETVEHGLRFGLVRNRDGFAVLLEELRLELRRLRPGEPREDVPVLDGDELLDLLLAVADQLQRDRLHATLSHRLRNDGRFLQ